MEALGHWLRKKAERLRQGSLFSTLSSDHSGISGKEERLFIENGRKLLEKIIASFNGRCNPIRSFSAEDLQKATDYFQSYCYSNDFDWFEGILDGRLVLIKKYKDFEYDGHGACNNAWSYPLVFRDKKEEEEDDDDDFDDVGVFLDISTSSQMSSHKNVLKLLGCCLEFPIPMLVYEQAENGPLNVCGGIGSSEGLSSLSWKIRLKVAKDIANALTYLHTAFSRPIIHRNVKPQNIFLDKDFVAKLSDFSVSISIPEGETYVKDEVAGTQGFVDPVYKSTKSVTEQSDVYSFGVFLLILLSGRPAYDELLHDLKKEEFDEIVDPKIVEEGGICGEQQIQLQAFLELALKCVEDKREDRPLMIEVGKELMRIERGSKASSS
ncbi:non-functional pseudokinase ZED1-like [Humulus lupulus]|uniref:non-functional pseudokinase ZED1-like n=1 Tax=Humulus lupulus TaxID=3486 RepID=UPI002B40EA58|nr:non-functional pseudokinase ZED1-like [Humulus lupulus]